MKKLSLIVSILVFISCSSESNGGDENNQNRGTLLTAQINGQSYASDDQNVSATLFLSDSFSQFVIAGSYLDSEVGSAVSEGIGIGFTFENLDQLSPGAIWDSLENQGFRTVVGSYSFGAATLSSADVVLADSNQAGGYAIFEITALNTETNTISGDFSFLAIDEDTGQEYLVTQGKINEVPYTTN